MSCGSSVLPPPDNCYPDNGSTFQLAEVMRIGETEFLICQDQADANAKNSVALSPTTLELLIRRTVPSCRQGKG